MSDSLGRRERALPEDSPVLFFDGECVLCQRTVQFVVKRERNTLLKFASLQSGVAQRQIPQNLRPPVSDSLVLWENGTFYGKSQAVLRLAKYLKMPWHAGYWLRWLPRFLADPLYDVVAKRRYRWFGQSLYCMLIPGLGERLIGDE